MFSFSSPEEHEGSMNGFIFQEAGSHPFLRGRMQVLILFYREDAGSRPLL